MPRYFRSLQFRLIAFCIAMALLGFAMRVWITLPYMQGQIEELAGSQQMSIATYAAHDIEQRLSSRIALVEVLAETLPVAVLAKPTELQAWLMERQRLNPLFNSLMVVDRDGHGLLGEYPAIKGRQSLDFREQEWFRGAVAGNVPVIGKPVRSRVNGDPLIVVAASARDRAGHVVAVVAGVIRLDAPGFLDMIRNTRVGMSGGLLLASPGDGIYVAAYRPEMTLQPLPAPGENAFHDRAMAGFRGIGLSQDRQGEKMLCAVASVPGSPWFVVAHLPAIEAFQPVAALRGYFMRNTWVVLLGGFVLLTLLLPVMLRPLRGLAEEMRRMANGDKPLQTLPVNGPEEVGDVARGFNHLVDQLLDKERALESSREHLSFLAHHDPLTGLPNRALLEDRLQQTLAHAERNGREVALLFCDLDSFKPVNDIRGHDVGDKLLRAVAERLCDGRRRADTVARLGGDEFVILLGDLKDAEKAGQLVAEQCVAAMAQPFDIDGAPLHVGISIGIATHRGASLDVAHLLSQADTAMYQAKRAGKGCFAFFRP